MINQIIRVGALLCGIIASSLTSADANAMPEQVSVTYGLEPTTSLTAQWVTMEPPMSNQSVIEYWTPYNTKHTSTGFNFVFNGTSIAKRNFTIHQAQMTNLEPDTKYTYRVGNVVDGWSDFFKVRTPPTTYPTKYLVFGDLGDVNARSTGLMEEDVLQYNITAILHVGDMGYNLDTDDGRVGDRYMRDMQPLIATTPYLVAHGNHEYAYNFYAYTYRYNHMPSNSPPLPYHTDVAVTKNNWFYSFNVARVHFVVFSTDIYIFNKEAPYTVIHRQHNWLSNDLKNANQDPNIDWIIVYTHRPFYCTNMPNGTDCTTIADLLRNGDDEVNGLEQILEENDVDLVISAHMHNYERLTSIANNKTIQNYTMSPTTKIPTLTNPKSPVYMVSGSAGCMEIHDPFGPNVPPYSFFRSTLYSYTRLTISNASYLHWEQISSDPSDYNRTIDQFALTRKRSFPEPR